VGRNLTNEDYLAESINPNGISWLGRPRQWGVDDHQAVLRTKAPRTGGGRHARRRAAVTPFSPAGTESCGMPAASNR
jgi:hypothetical protein